MERVLISILLLSFAFADKIDVTVETLANLMDENEKLDIQKFSRKVKKLKERGITPEKYYSQQGNIHYYLEAVKIAAGKNIIVNFLNELAALSIGQARQISKHPKRVYGAYPKGYWSKISKSGIKIVKKYKNLTEKSNMPLKTKEAIKWMLASYDAQYRRMGNIGKDGAVMGNDIDTYHNKAFEQAGISPFFYGNNPTENILGVPGQAIHLSPVPMDYRRLAQLGAYYTFNQKTKKYQLSCRYLKVIPCKKVQFPKDFSEEDMKTFIKDLNNAHYKGKPFPHKKYTSKGIQKTGKGIQKK